MGKSNFVGEHRHSIEILIACLVVFVFGLAILFAHWSTRPLQVMRAKHASSSMLDIVKYSKVKSVEKHSESSAKEVPILLYHGILDGPNDGFSITQSEFNDQMINLKKAGYTTVDMQQYLDFINGKILLPEKSIMISFDDGRKDSYYRGDPILHALGFKAVMFLTSGYSIVDGSRYYLDRHELLTMNSSGRWDIEAHADYAGTNQIFVDSKGTTENFFGHLKWLPKENRLETLEEYRVRVTSEFSTVKSRLTTLLGKGAINTLSFPFGDYAQPNADRRLEPVLLGEAAKYFQQVYVQFRKGESYSSNYANDNHFISRRIEVNPNLSGEQLVNKLALNIAKPTSYVASLTQHDGWRSEWGEISYQPNKLHIVPEKGATTSATYLDGTKLLNSYSVNATFDTLGNSSTSIELASLYKDKNNYVGCIFYDNKIKLEGVTDGEKYPISEVSMPNGYRVSNTIGSTMQGTSSVGCRVNGKTVLTGIWDISNKSGGPAIFVRNATPNTGIADLTAYSYSANQPTLDTLRPVSTTEQNSADANTLYRVNTSNPASWAADSGASLNVSYNSYSISAAPKTSNNVIRANYAKGSYAGKLTDENKSATIFKVLFNKDGIDIGDKDEIYLQYKVYFDKDFNFNKSGVLPGLGGGTNTSGGKSANGYNGWSTRLMWQGNKFGTYSYLPNSYKYGQEFPWVYKNQGAEITTGTWQCLGLHIKLNDINDANGVIESTLNGKQVFRVDSVIFRYTNTLRISNILFETFFGGSDPTFASPKDQHAYFDDITLSTRYISCN